MARLARIVVPDLARHAPAADRGVRHQRQALAGAVVVDAQQVLARDERRLARFEVEPRGGQGLAHGGQACRPGGVWPSMSGWV
jgi:hypothetical protein